MVAELGMLALILALLWSILLVILPLVFHEKINISYYVCGLWFCLASSYLCLTYCFITDDFSVIYVLKNSSVLLPIFYKLCAAWGGHEGSMLLWVCILSTWMLGVNFFSKSIAYAMREKVLVVLSALSAGFIIFLLFTSNPFLRQFEVLNTLGKDLNPLLQDPGFLFHPPMLYMGYVGFSVAFAFAIAVLLLKEAPVEFLRWIRPWTLAAWCFLTLGITLGSWWAYRELGWGGWWFWDPVENASFMPWLIGTALLHSIIVSEKRQQFVGWTLLLSVMSFSLSLIGTFLVRSGVLTSVHAFAVDPARGMFILLFLFIVIGGSLLLFAMRAHLLPTKTSINIVSRESALLLNNVFLVVATITILMGTTYPLIIDSLGLGKLSVGAPYFNAVFIPLMLPMLALMGIGIHIRWQHSVLKNVIRDLMWLIILSVLCAIFLRFASHAPLLVLLGVCFAAWIVFSTVFLFYQRIKQVGFFKISLSFWGMMLAHLGVAISVLGMSISSGFGVSQDLKMSPGEYTLIQGFKITFVREMELHGPNYHGVKAQFNVQHNKVTTTIYPEKRIYNAGKMALTDSAIDVTPFRDIYVALGEPLDSSAWSVRVYYKPFVRWIWAGGFWMFAGGVCAILALRGKKR